MERITSKTDPFEIGMMLGTLPQMDADEIECPQCHACHFVPDDGQEVCDDCDDTNSYEMAMETREDY
tara:strand:+ start:1878 stop:2078 length:201 start_codon:yes stop_codon:yes gene_type:complete